MNLLVGVTYSDLKKGSISSAMPEMNLLPLYRANCCRNSCDTELLDRISRNLLLPMRLIERKHQPPEANPLDQSQSAFTYEID